MAGPPEGKDASTPPQPRWPKVIGTIGAVLGAIMLVDKADDLALVPLMWSDESRRLLLGPQWAEIAARSLPGGAWLLFFHILCGGLLGLLLVLGSLRLRHRQRSGVTLCRVWAWLAIGWLAVGLAGTLWWLAKHTAEISRYAGPGWDQGAVSGVLVALVLLVYPVFLLIWLSRASVKEEVQSWHQ